MSTTDESGQGAAPNGGPMGDVEQRRTEPRVEHGLTTREQGMAPRGQTHQDPNDAEADEKPSGIAEAEHAPAASVVNRTLRKGASAASALGEHVSKTASAVTPLATEVRKTAETAEKTTRNIAQTAERATRNIAKTSQRTALGIADRLTTVLIVCIQALWAGLAFTVVIVNLPHPRGRVFGPPVRHTPVGARGGIHRPHPPRPPRRRKTAAHPSGLCVNYREKGTRQ